MQQTLRIGLLVSVLSGVWLGLGRSLLISAMGQAPAIPAINLADPVPLSRWQLDRSQPLAEQSSSKNPSTNQGKIGSSAIAASQAYIYQQTAPPEPHPRSTELHIEMRYLVGASVDVKELLMAHPAHEFSRFDPTLIQRQSNIGSYALFTIQSNAYLTSCINPSGSSTLTRQQFNQNRLLDAFSTRLWLWFLNQAEIPDRRCLWVYAWTPIQQSPEATYPVLEQAWHEWYQHWRSWL
jgi:cyanosortase A-associated protein